MLSLFLAAALAAPAPAAAAAAKTPTADDFVGRWNVRITDAEDTFVSAGFQIDKKGEGIAAGLVWKWGSFAKVRSAEVKEGVLRMVREDQPGKRDVFEARLEGGLLAGEAKLADGAIRHFEGKRAPELESKKKPKWGKPVPLFDGQSLKGWRLRDEKAKNGWAVANGELVVVEPKGNADLVSEVPFKDAKLHVEFNVEPKSNSGVYVRGRYEVQILDNPDAKMALDSHGCGAVYSRIAPRSDAAREAGEWQTLDITMVGRHATVVLNGVEVVNGIVDGITGGAIDPYEDRPGPLMLQGDHGKVRFRNITLTPAK
jgi:hypothetical protein